MSNLRLVVAWSVGYLNFFQVSCLRYGMGTIDMYLQYNLFVRHHTYYTHYTPLTLLQLHDTNNESNIWSIH